MWKVQSGYKKTKTLHHKKKLGQTKYCGVSSLSSEF